MLNLIGPILGIVDKTMGMLAERQRTKYKRDYHDLLKEADEIYNQQEDGKWSDDRIDAFERKFVRFITAFHDELSKQKK